MCLLQDAVNHEQLQTDLLQSSELLKEYEMKIKMLQLEKVAVYHIDMLLVFVILNIMRNTLLPFMWLVLN